MNNSVLKQVHIDQIDFNDQTYLFTFESPISQLIASIKHIGLLHPPVLEQKAENCYRIVSGLKRILALRHIKIDWFQAQVFESKKATPSLELFLLNLYENIGTRSLNAIEKSIVIHKVINLFRLSEDRVITEFLPMLGLGSNKVVLNRYLNLMQLEDNIKIAIVEDFVSIDLAIILLVRSSQERLAIFDLLQTLKAGKNHQKEILRLLQELSEITGEQINQIIEYSEIQNILTNDKITLPRKTECITEILKKLRYPLYTKLKENFQNLKNELRLPPNISFRPSPFFEGEKYTIEMTFKNQSEFEKLIGILSAIAEQKKLAKLETLV